MASNSYNFDNITYQKYNPKTEFHKVELIWKSLLQRIPHSFFLSWGWILAWLKTLPENISLSLVVGYVDNNAVVAFFAGENPMVRHRFIYSKVLGINTTANPDFDGIYIEHNSLLGDGFGISEIYSILDGVALNTWDELKLNGFVLDSAELSAIDQNQFNIIIDREEESHFVNLKKIRENNMDYYQFLSSSKRQQIRRSIREYEKKGTIKIRIADNVNLALEMLKNLKELNQKRRIEQGESGAFDIEYFEKFHEALVKECFNRGEIQLICVYVDEEIIGYIYNFIYNQNVLFYQCGFNYKPNNVYRPGMVSHYYAIMHNAQKGYLIYDFLVGAGQYKQSLSMGSQKMYWLRIQKKRRRFWIENKLKEIKSRLRR